MSTELYTHEQNTHNTYLYKQYIGMYILFIYRYVYIVCVFLMCVMGKTHTIHTYINKSIHEYIYTYMYAYTHTHASTHTYTHAHIHTHRCEVVNGRTPYEH